jgi:UDP-perosamine 4-acetyltransferase
MKMNTDIILAGGGGHALSLMEALAFDHARGADAPVVAGYTAPADAPCMTVPRLGSDDDAATLAAEGYRFHIAFVYAGLPVMDKRRRIISLYEEAGVSFASIVASSAVVTPNSTLGEGCAVLNRAVVNRATLGAHVIVNTGAIVEHDCVVGANTFIGPGAVIGGGVTIGQDCFIGLGARVRNGVTIADGVTVGMGCIVNRNLTEPGIYHGDPLRLHKLRNRN